MIKIDNLAAFYLSKAEIAEFLTNQKIDIPVPDNHEMCIYIGTKGYPYTILFGKDDTLNEVYMHKDGQYIKYTRSEL